MAIIKPDRIEVEYGFRIHDVEKFYASLENIAAKLKAEAKETLAEDFARIYLFAILRNDTVDGLDLKKEYEEVQRYHRNVHRGLIELYGNPSRHLEGDYDLSANVFFDEYVQFFANKKSKHYLEELQGCENISYNEYYQKNDERHRIWSMCFDERLKHNYNYIELYHEGVPSFDVMMNTLLDFDKTYYIHILDIIFEHDAPEDVFDNERLNKEEQKLIYISTKAEEFYTYVQNYLED